MALSLELCRGKQLWNIWVQTDSLCCRHWDRNYQQSSQSENAALHETAHRDQALLIWHREGLMIFLRFFCGWFVCEFLFWFLVFVFVVFFFKAIFQSHSVIFPQVKTQLLIVGVPSWWGCEAGASTVEIPHSMQRLCCSLSFIAWMERVTAQHKYLDFSLFLAGLLKHRHEQIAFGFVRMGEAKQRQSWVWAKSCAQERQRLLPGLCPGVQGWSSSTGSFITVGRVDSWSLIRVYIKDGCWLWITAQGRISHR